MRTTEVGVSEIAVDESAAMVWVGLAHASSKESATVGPGDTSQTSTATAVTATTAMERLMTGW